MEIVTRFVVLLIKTVDLARSARRSVSVAPKTPKADFSDFFGVFGALNGKRH